MKIYAAFIQYNDYETQPEYIGCYSTKEKAREAIVKALIKRGENASPLEFYGEPTKPNQIFGVFFDDDRPNYIYGIEEYNLDE